MRIEEAKKIVRKEAYRVYQQIGYDVFGDDNASLEDIRDVTADCFEANVGREARDARQILISDGTFERTVGEAIGLFPISKSCCEGCSEDCREKCGISVHRKCAHDVYTGRKLGCCICSSTF